ncbi:MAG: hypothetical protein ACOCX9_04520 [Spirochaetota bacterium]
MKKILLTVAISFIFVSSAWAEIYIDVSGMYNQTGDAENQMGLSSALGITVTSDLTAYFRFYTSGMTKDSDTVNEVTHNQEAFLGGIEYAYRFSSYPVFWKSSIALGTVSTSTDWDDTTDPDHINKKESGMAAGLYTGVEYILSQRVSPFVEIGYLRTFYEKDYEKDTIAGVQVYAGVRVTVWGKNKGLFDDYE